MRARPVGEMDVAQVAAQILKILVNRLAHIVHHADVHHAFQERGVDLPDHLRCLPAGIHQIGCGRGQRFDGDDDVVLLRGIRQLLKGSAAVRP